MMMHCSRAGGLFLKRAGTRSLASSVEQVRFDALDAAGIERFNAEGAIVLRGFVGDKWLSVLRAASEANLSDPGPLCDEHAAVGSGRFHDDQFLWLRHAAMEDFVLRSGAGAVAARAMRSESAHILYDQLFVKEPGTAASTPYHNDTSYWHLRGQQVSSIWVALDPVAKDAGLSYVKASHKEKIQHRITKFSGDTSEYSTDKEELPPVPSVEGRDLLNWDMEAGDALLFYSAMIHGAPGIKANSKNRRRGYATRWCGDDIRFEDRPGTMHKAWKNAGFDSALQDGDPIKCKLHPNVVAPAA